MELRLAWQAISFHSLPESGGLLDQPAGLLSRMIASYNAWQAIRSWQQVDPTKRKEWIDANPELHALKIELDRMMAKKEKRRA